MREEGNHLAAFDWDGLVRWLAHETGVSWPADLARLTDEVVAGLAPHAQRRFLYPDAIPTLCALRERGWRIAAATNGYVRYQAPLLRHLGLFPLFDALLGPDVTGCVKPDVRVFNALGPRERVRAHVGDMLSQDVALARNVGALAVWLRRRPGLTAPTRRAVQRRLATEFHRVPIGITIEEAWPDAIAASLRHVLPLVGLP